MVLCVLGLYLGALKSAVAFLVFIEILKEHFCSSGCEFIVHIFIGPSFTLLVYIKLFFFGITV